MTAWRPATELRHYHGSVLVRMRGSFVPVQTGWLSYDGSFRIDMQGSSDLDKYEFCPIPE